MTEAPLPVNPRTRRSSLLALEAVRTPNGQGLFGSADLLFRDAVFGRDSLEAAEDVVAFRPEIAEEVIVALAKLQGTRFDPSGPQCTEEEPGRIHHEHRELVIDGRHVSDHSAAILHQLSERWGGSSIAMTYYGTVDATPLFARLIVQYCELWGDALLARTLVNKDGVEVRVRDSLIAAVEWVVRRVRTSHLGLLDSLRRNPDGAGYQMWTDGLTSLAEPDGHLLDPDVPIATPELQGLAYDALMGAARVLDDADRATALEWTTLAQQLRDRALGLFWMRRQRYLATAVTFDTNGRLHVVRTMSARGGEVLDTELFDLLPSGQRDMYVEGIARRVCSPEFLCDAGVRTLSLRHADIADYWPYQSSFTSWIKQTYDITKGLRRQGLPQLATTLETRLLNITNIGGVFAEFCYVDESGRVLCDPMNTRGRPDPRVIAGTNLPERIQTWTVTALLAIKWRRGHLLDRGAPLAATECEQSILRRMRRTPLLTRIGDCLASWDASPPVVIDRDLGYLRERRWVVRQDEERRDREQRSA